MERNADWDTIVSGATRQNGRLRRTSTTPSNWRRIPISAADHSEDEEKGTRQQPEVCSGGHQTELMVRRRYGRKYPWVNGTNTRSIKPVVDRPVHQHQRRTRWVSCLLVFPPNSMSMGGKLRPEMALAHFKAIADTTDLP